jgi:hypothetical protein
MNYGIVLMGLLIGGCALFYYRAAEFENSSGVGWAGLSLLVSVLCWRVFHFGWLGVLLGQVALFIGITICRASKKP